MGRSCRGDELSRFGSAYWKIAVGGCSCAGSEQFIDVGMW